MIQDIFPHRLHNEFSMAKAPGPGDLVYWFDKETVLSGERDGALVLPSVSLLTEAGIEAAERLVYLFGLDERSYYLYFDPDIPWDGSVGASGIPEGFSFRSFRELRGRKLGPREEMFALTTAMQLSHWYQGNRFCGRCGERTRFGERERSLVCPSCGNVLYPRIVPAVIVAVTNGDSLLLTQYRGRGTDYYALVAGFTEIGETLEECVQREVMEEAGIRVKNIRYYKSQPWGMVDDLLTGFWCEVDGDARIRMDEGELKFASWVRREDIVLQPDDYSLTNEMMTRFRQGREREDVTGLDRRGYYR